MYISLILVPIILWHMHFDYLWYVIIFSGLLLWLNWIPSHGSKLLSWNQKDWCFDQLLFCKMHGNIKKSILKEKCGFFHAELHVCRIEEVSIPTDRDEKSNWDLCQVVNFSAWLPALLCFALFLFAGSANNQSFLIGCMLTLTFCALGLLKCSIKFICT